LRKGSTATEAVRARLAAPAPGWRVEVEVRAQAVRVLARVLDGAGPIARGVERVHQRLGVHARVRVGSHQPAAGTHPAVHVPGSLLTVGEGEERVDVGVGELAPALVEPVGEVRRVVQVEPVQQRAGVEPHDALVVARHDRGPQLVQVAAQAGRVEEEPIVGRDDRAVAERRAQHVDREIEQAAGAGHIALGPE
jgi:hypothetical protein